MRQIYLDYQASTPMDERVLQAMLEWLTRPANPHASENEPGRLAHEAVEKARAEIAAALGAEPECVLFTSGATEAANLALRSLVPGQGHLAISAIEHPCVTETGAELERRGARLTVIPVDGDGLVDIEEMERVLDDAPDLVSIMAVNNEVGTVQPISEIAAMCAEVGVAFHSDAAQALGRVPVCLTSGLSALTISGHKVYGPQGIGAIAVAPDALPKLKPMLTGGGQQGGIRPGTLPVALCVGLGEACRLAVLELEADRRHVQDLRDRMLGILGQELGTVVVNGSLADRVPHNLNLAIPGVDAQELLARAPRLALSTGSACSSGAIELSRVLAAMGVDPVTAAASIRIGFGRGTSIQDVEAAAMMIAGAARACREARSTGVGA
ncbi:cysteine desulfurase family protein [Methylobacterium sp. Leaf88]|uniref:cysteine desulfurase family protein n=1 Tax=Methylobacterium sp. Leaf88 TaxID=1736244 RepID=UPI0006FA7B58|nr:cysteine desulfurase family protein [Methylobacterium sp. Leaf88]KQO70627.1 hypothetical protein ASF20_19205 [Methylobacterium sp. Leaf88]